MIYNMTKVLPRDALTKFSASCKLFFYSPSIFLSLFSCFVFCCRDAHISFMRRRSSSRREEQTRRRCGRAAIVQSSRWPLNCPAVRGQFKLLNATFVGLPPKKIKNKTKTKQHFFLWETKIELSSLCFEYVYVRALKRPHIVRDCGKIHLPCVSSIACGLRRRKEGNKGTTRSTGERGKLDADT